MNDSRLFCVSQDVNVAAKTRYPSIDVVRGINIVLMLLVNNIALGELTPKQLMHAPWGESIRVADLVFPWFLLCAGFSMPFSYASAKRKGMGTPEWIRKSLARTVMLLAVGMFLDSAIQRHPYFGLGVLQLIALATFVASLLMVFSAKVRGAIAGVLLVGYGLAIQVLPVPGFDYPVFEEEHNLIQHLNTMHFEPLGLRGLPSVIPTAALVLLGVLVGEALKEPPVRRYAVLTLGGAAGVVFGLLWGDYLPMNKAVWTPSLLLFAAGTGAWALMLASLTFDSASRERLAWPLSVFGAQALAAYAGPILVKVLILQIWTLHDKPLIDLWLSRLVNAYGQWTGGWLYTWSYIGLAWLALALWQGRQMGLRSRKEPSMPATVAIKEGEA
jgi:predicted acyltransferase